MSKSEMVERCAKAIYESRNGPGAKAWARLTNSYRGEYIMDARAAIAAMREPTEAMLCDVVTANTAGVVQL